VKGVQDREILVSGFITAIQAFAKEALISPDGGDIQSMKLSQTLLTFRLIKINNNDGKLVQFYFVLLTELTKKQKLETDSLLEYLCLNFLSYDSGAFRNRMRKTYPQMMDFKQFDQFLLPIVNSEWKDIKKKIKPIPSSILQGMLNEIREYLPIDKIQQLHPKLVRLGPSYVWLSDDLPSEEEQLVLSKIKENIAHLFGERLYEDLLKDVRRRLSLVGING
jgi:ATP adenylyltransferase/5',5'''-P-1,P-4-tetraphosphate phosphorylase II